MNYSSTPPVISIVTPTYNQGHYIRQTIDSILGQDYPHLEYWVIDGGSTDDTVSILREYEHDPRFYWLSEKDRGQSHAINKGIDRCTGDIFNWINSDDILLPGALRKIADTWQKQDQPTIIYGLSRLMDASGNDIGYYAPQTTHATLDKFLRLDSFPMQPATFIPLATLKQVGSVDESYHYVMDAEMYLRLFPILPMIFVDYDICSFRYHEASKSIAATAKFTSELLRAWQGAVDQGLLTVEQAKSYPYLFGARLMLLPHMNDRVTAHRYLLTAISYNRASWRDALMIWIKGVARLTMGEKLWAKGRQLKLQVGR